MPKVNFINKENIPVFFESLADTVTKSVDEFDLFEYDGLLNTIPFGKLISFAAKKIIQIQDIEKALAKSIRLSGLLSYIDGLRKFNINPVVEDVFLKDALLEIKKSSLNKQFGYINFDINSFNKNDVTKFSQKQLIDFSSKVLSENEVFKLKKHLKDFHKQYFLKLLEDNKLTFEKLSTYFSKDSYEEIIVNIKKEAYRDLLATQYFEIILNDLKGLKLSDIYIEPQYNIHKNCFSENDKRIKRINSQDDKGFIKLEDNSIHDQVYKFLLGKPILDLKNKNANVLFVLGYPGQGKSSFCKKMLYDTIGGSKIVDKDIYFIKFRNITNTYDLIYSPINTLYEHLLNQINFEITKNDFKSSILILDGLDELFMKENLQYSSIDEFCRVLIREIESNDFPRIIITSRYGYINTERLKTENALIFQLREFNLDQQKKWLNIFSKFHPETLLTPEKLSEINGEDDKKYSYLRELINQPILLHLIASLEDEIDINTNRAKIYENLFTQLIKRNWAKEGQIDNLIGIQQEDLRDFLREIAFAIFLSGNEYINKSTLTTLQSTKVFLEKLQNKEFQDSLKRIMIAFYFQEVKKGEKDDIKEDKNDYAIEFLHKSLQEYLVAEKIWNSVIFLADKNSRTGKFNIDDDKTAFELINGLFSKKYLSKEISNYLEEIVKNDSLVDKSILVTRLTKFLPGFLENDFLMKGEMISERNILLGAMSNFTGYWLLISSTQQSQNFIPTEHKDKFTFFLRFFTNENAGIDLSYQDLSGTNMEGVNLSMSNLSYSNFSDCFMEGSDLNRSILVNTNFERTDLYRVTFENAKLENTNFKDASLINSILYNQDARSCFFEGANLKATIFSKSNITGVSFANCHLEHTVFLDSTVQSYDQFEKVLLIENCVGLIDDIENRINRNKHKK